MQANLKRLLFKDVIVLDRAIKRKNTFLKSDSILIFTCGAHRNDPERRGRATLLEYANKHLHEYKFFMAEDFFDTFSGADKSNLLSLEEQMAQYSDCIVIVLESESTFAELGAFAISKEIAQLCLIINEIEFKDSESFINQGPIKKLNDVSLFKPVINVKLESISTAFNELESRLRIIKKERNKSVDFSTYEKLSKGTSKHRLLFLLDLISLFSPIKNTELVDILKLIYGDEDFKIGFEKALLKALGMIEIRDDYIYQSVNDMKLYFEYKGFNVNKLRARVVNLYHKYSRDRMTYLVSR